MQVSFDITKEEDRAYVQSLIEGYGGKPAAGRVRKTAATADAAPAVAAPVPAVAGTPAASAPVAPAAAPVAPAAPVGMPPIPAFMQAQNRPDLQAVPSPVPPAPVAAPAPSGIQKATVTQAIQTFTSTYKVTAARQRMTEFANAFGLPQPMAIDSIPEHLYAQALEYFKVQ